MISGTNIPVVIFIGLLCSVVFGKTGVRDAGGRGGEEWVAKEGTLPNGPGDKRVKRFRDGYTPLASSCDYDPMTFRGTDNRWSSRPEVSSTLRDAEFESNAFVTSGGTLPGVGSERGDGGVESYLENREVAMNMMTHCPDARIIACDDVSNLFHAPNYISVPMTTDRMERFFGKLFGYELDATDFRCSDYVNVRTVREERPRGGTRGNIHDSGRGRKKLMFHSMQIVGDRTVNPTDDDGDTMSCENPFGDYDRNSETYGSSSPPFFCVYSVVSEESTLTGSVGCSGIAGGGSVKVLDDDDGSIGPSEGIVLYREDQYLVDPNCGSSGMNNETAFPNELSGPVPPFNSPRENILTTEDGFFQIWMKPVEWNGRYNWERLYSRDSSSSGVGFRNVIERFSDRFPNCVYPAKKRRGDLAAGLRNLNSDLCMPHLMEYERRQWRLPTGTCLFSRQIECAPPPEASQVNQGTECYCSFPYARDVKAEQRDPWDIYCLSGDLSEPAISSGLGGSRASGGQLRRIGNMYGEDTSINSGYERSTQLIREITDFQWTYYDWTPVFTKPPTLFTCPPPGYITAVRDDDGRWKLISAIRPEYHSWWLNEPTATSTFSSGYAEHPNAQPENLAFFSDLNTAWEGSWPEGIPEPNGPEVKIPFDDQWNEQTTTPEENEEQIEKYLEFKDYIFTARFESVTIETKNERALAAANSARFLSTNTPSTSKTKCRSSETPRHYATYSQQNQILSPDQTKTTTQTTTTSYNPIQCTYDFSMTYKKKKTTKTPTGTTFETIPQTYKSTAILNAPSQKTFPIPHSFSQFSRSKWKIQKSNPESVNGKSENSISTDDFLSETTDVYSCSSISGLTSECVMSSSRDVVRAALANAESRDGNRNIERWKKLTGFGTGVCATAGLDWYMKVYGGVDDDTRALAMNCLKPSADYVRRWYYNVLGFESEDDTFSRFLYDATEEEYLYHGSSDVFPPWTPENLFASSGVYEVSNAVDSDEFLGESRPDIVRTKFYQSLFETSYLRAYIDGSGDRDTIRKRVYPFREFYCPHPKDIIYRPGHGFTSKGRSGSSWTSNWVFSSTEHNLAELARLKETSTDRRPLVVPSYTSDVDSSSIRFLASYETTSHQCKYYYQNTATMQIPYSNYETNSRIQSGSSHYSTPRFFYLSSNAGSVRGFDRYSKLTNETNATEACPPDIANVTDPEEIANEDYGCNKCQIRIDPTTYSSKIQYLTNVTTMFFARPETQRINNTTGLPETTYQVHFGQLVTTPPRSRDDINLQIRSIVEDVKRHHPFHSSSTPVKYCSGTITQCSFITPTIPCSRKQFVNRG